MARAYEVAPNADRLLHRRAVMSDNTTALYLVNLPLQRFFSLTQYHSTERRLTSRVEEKS